LTSSSSETSEAWAIDLEQKQIGEPQKLCFRKRQKGILYDVDHHDKDFYIITNLDGATNFKLMSLGVDRAADGKWKEVFKYKPEMKIDNVHCFKDFIALEGRLNGFSQVWTFKPSDPQKTLKMIEFEDESHAAELGPNEEFESQKIRLSYDSLTIPRRVYDFDPISSTLDLLKEQPVPSYDPSLYASERVEVKAKDGTMIPLSIVYRRDKIKTAGPNPLHLYGYGSYEISIDPQFSSLRLPLLDRGVVYAIAHVRGGGEMGRTWYESAKYAQKVRTFTDFIDCAQHLVRSGKTTADMLSIEGRSAGGLLVGAVVNMAPGLFKAALAGVPFVDVMNTMSDPSIPLTTGEWEEWGNPNMEPYYSDMLRWSPYDNVAAQGYPAIFVASGLYDPRVAYWEPAKWVQKLREFKTDDNPVLLKMDLSAGHFSASDRYRLYWERSLEICFVLDKLKCLESVQLPPSAGAPEIKSNM